jgi:ABC-type polysaccharide/polyol phosphate transport system ATPase subunit
MSLGGRGGDGRDRAQALAEVRRLVDRVVWIDDGKISMQGESEAVMEAYAKS